MKISKRQLKRIIKEERDKLIREGVIFESPEKIYEMYVADNIKLTTQDADLSEIAEHFGFKKTKREYWIRQRAPRPEPMKPNEYEITDDPAGSGTRLTVPGAFSVHKFWSLGKWSFSIRMNDKRSFLGPFRSVESVIDYIEKQMGASQ